MPDATFNLLSWQSSLTMAFQHFKLKLAPDKKIGLLPEATLRPKHGMRMFVEDVS